LHEIVEKKMSIENIIRDVSAKVKLDTNQAKKLIDNISKSQI
jgi:hypothetical protein